MTDKLVHVHIKWRNGGQVVHIKWTRNCWQFNFMSDEQEIAENLVHVKWIRNGGEVDTYQMCKKLLKNVCVSNE